MKLRIASALTLVVLLGGVTEPWTATAAPAPAPPASATGGPRTVTLVTGERVTVTAGVDGRPAVTVAPGSTSRAFQVLTSGSHLYVIPQEATGYLGAPLDLSLFDVNAADPATLNYSGTAPSLPGTAVTAPGQLIVRDPAAFGRALAADAKTHRLFAGVHSLSRADAQDRHTPPGKLYTLTVRGVDRLGHPAANTDGIVMNADNIDNFLAGQGFYNGTFSFSVPAGHYSIESYIPTSYPDRPGDYTLAAAPEVSVTRDTTVVLDARKGVRMSATVDRPTNQAIGELNLQRNPATGLSLTDSFTAWGPTALYATPTEPVRTGQLYFYPRLRLTDASNVYDMDFPYVDAIPATLTHTISDDQLATIDATYHSSVPGRIQFESREGVMPWQASNVFVGTEFAAPATRTEHVLPMPDMQWSQEVLLDSHGGSGFMQDTPRPYTAGQHTSTDWAAQPTAPGIQQSTGVQGCPVCRTGDTLDVALWGYSDNDGHLMLPDPSMTTESMRLFQDGTPVGRGPVPAGLAEFPLSASPASYRLDYDTTRTAPWWPSSTASHTSWTFASAERAPDPLPPGWTCGLKGGGGTDCSFEPLLFTRYDTGAGADDVVPAGQPASVEVDVAHQQGAAATPITQFAAQVSYNDGTTWTDVPATKIADGRYRLDYDQPELNATNGFASLHVTAADANGSAIDQTITRAYPLAVTAPAPPSGDPGAPQQRACSTPTAPPFLQCMAILNAATGTTDDPQGYGPDDIRGAYRVTQTGQGRTVAIVDAYDDPNAESDLADYRAQYGLPPCTSANGCFRKVNQNGNADPLPSPDPGWGLEISLDVDAVSATCPDCHILLIEAQSPNLNDLLTGVLTADALHVDAISNSYGSRGEFSGEQAGEPYLRALHSPAIFATGDYGYGNGRLLVGSISYPAASRYTIAVGGTSLIRDGSDRGWTETAWDGATSGCSAYIPKPSWQHDRLCDMRTDADISAVADPETGLAVRDTFGYDGWVQVGGTSLAAPIVSSLYAMRGGTADLRDLYHDQAAVFDAVGGSNGTNCSDTYLCTAVPGYDGPTGLGTPDASDSYWRS